MKISIFILKFSPSKKENQSFTNHINYLAYILLQKLWYIAAYSFCVWNIVCLWLRTTLICSFFEIHRNSQITIVNILTMSSCRDKYFVGYFFDIGRISSIIYSYHVFFIKRKIKFIILQLARKIIIRANINLKCNISIPWACYSNFRIIWFKSGINN